MVQGAYRGAWASAISASVPSGQAMGFATHSIGIPVRYTCTLLGSRQRCRLGGSHVSVVRLVCVPNACVPLPVRRQCLRSAANEAAALLATSRGQSHVARNTVCAACAMDMGADRLWCALNNGRATVSDGVDWTFLVVSRQGSGEVLWCRLLAAVCRAVGV